ncbi:MAG: alkaline phosphatase family protein [Candidatus Cybelea sp.]
MVRRLSVFFLAGAVLTTSGCSLPTDRGSGNVAVSGAAGSSARPATGSPISHIVVIIQENRSVDNLFNGFPGADTVTSGQNIYGQTVSLKPESLAAPYDMGHRHGSWLLDYNQGNMNGFSTESIDCYAKHGQCPPRDVAAYGYVPKAEVQPYWDMAEQYTFADELFQTNQGPSFPAHQYLISGTSSIGNGSKYLASDNPGDTVGKGNQGGCDSVRSTTVRTIDSQGKQGPFVFPCFDRNSILQEMNEQSVSWHYYQEFKGSGQWHAPDAIENIRNGPSYTNVEWPSSAVLEDIDRGYLADVSFVTPNAAESDHSGRNNGSGPSWVASIVNRIGESQYWNSTAIIVIWDDWGGWYDHVPPKIFNSYELGFRVPMIVISPYAKPNYVSHVPYEFGSILKFIEETFDVASLNTTDVRATDLSDCFNFKGSPRPIKPIASKYSAAYFEHQPIDYESPDDDR